MNVYLIISISLIVYAILGWFVGSALGLQGSDLWIVRSALWIVGIVGSGTIAWFYYKEKKREAGTDTSLNAASFADIDSMLRQIDASLGAGRMGRGARLRNLPLFLVIGDSNSAKTTVMVKSGLEPELVAGQVFAGTDIIPTDLLNCWLSHGNVFLEVGRAIQPSSERWKRVAKGIRTSPFRVQGSAASRAVLLCYPTDALLRSDPTAAARKLRNDLEELSGILGRRVPTYVLFTKADRLEFFKEYVARFTNEEVDQVLGVTLPLYLNDSPGIYAESATQLIRTEFQRLFLSLSDFRTELLQRERGQALAEPEAVKLGAIYEFPREFGKIQNIIVQFLVELCRPSQIRLGPFLRGFYFCGVRAVSAQEGVPSSVTSPSAQANINATRVFRPDPVAGAPAASLVGSGHKPQWTFLRQVFHQILLKDQDASRSSLLSAQTPKLQTASLFVAIAFALIAMVGFTVSFLTNRALSSEIAETAIAIQPSTVDAIPTIADLSKLDALKNNLVRLDGYETNGVPWSLGWGLYSGHDMATHARQIYFNGLRRLVLDAVHRAVLARLSNLRAFAAPDDNFEEVLQALKVHLMLTTERSRTDRAFLSNYLSRHWTETHPASSPEIQQLVKSQFDFLGDPSLLTFSLEADPAVRENARRYLRDLGSSALIYQSMLMDAEKGGTPVNFNERIAGAADVIVNPYLVRRAFTKDGWKAMQDSLKNPTRYFGGENWVLGDAAAAGDSDTEKIRARYVMDYISHWRQFLKSTSIARAKNLDDAVSKLNKLQAPNSPLLALLFLVSDNTAVDSAEIKRAFQPVQYFVPPGTPDKYTGPANQSYLSALSQLELDLEQLAKAPGGQPLDPQLNQIQNSIKSASLAVRQAAQNFNLDAEAHIDVTIKTLLEQTIAIGESAVKSVPRDSVQRPN
jgi:type VI secretion system protein ImpL